MQFFLLICKISDINYCDAKQVGELKEDIDSALNGISRFIQSQMDFSTARQLAKQNKQKQEENNQQIADIKQVKLNMTIVEQPSVSTDSAKEVISVES